MAINLPKGIVHEIPQGFRLIGKLLFPEKIEALQTIAKIDSNGYALIKDGDVANSTISITQGFNGRNYVDTHTEVLERSLAIPTPVKFIAHLRNVNDALNERAVLYDAKGNLIGGDRLNQYAQGLNGNCWVWLNAGFSKGKGFRNLDLATITGLDGKGNPVRSIIPLENCLEQDCWADVTEESLNSQGFPTKKSPTGDKYEPGKTAYFWYPRQDSVAWFNAGSGGANFDCGGNPAFRNDSLGVFTSAEGASVAESQDKGVTA